MLFRRDWADYFDQQGIQYAFYSAALGIAIQEARKEAAEAMEREAEARNAEKEGSEQGEENVEEAENDEEAATPDIHISADDEDEDVSDPRIKILSVLELEDLFKKSAPPLSGKRIHCITEYAH